MRIYTFKTLTNRLAVLSVFIFLSDYAYPDIAPVAISAHGIISTGEKNYIRMESEVVNVDLWGDSAKVTCLFHMFNYGNDTTLTVGFPEMHFTLRHDMFFRNAKNAKNKFHIKVDENPLGYESIIISEPLDSLIRHIDKHGIGYSGPNDTIYPIYERLSSKVHENMQPWYVWEEHFVHNQEKIITVSYTLPNGNLINEKNSGYVISGKIFKYILSTGAGWFGTIGKADITVNILDEECKNSIEHVSPDNYKFNKSSGFIKWTFSDFEPTEEQDIEIHFKQQKNMILYE